MAEPESLGSTFNDAADLYDAVRPGYPMAIVDAIVSSSMIPAGGTILEVGCGTGQITRPFAERGYSLTALEPGDALASLARRKFLSHPNVDIIETSFEEWPEQREHFDLVLSAQAFHWIEPEYGCTKSATVLKPGGAIALVWNLDASQGTPFYRATNPIYSRFFSRAAADTDHVPLVDKADRCREALRNCTAFPELEEYRHSWIRSYTGEDYLKLLHTFSNHRTLPEPDKSHFFEAILSEIERADGVVHRRYETLLILARKL